jgi:hypothetical protein
VCMRFPSGTPVNCVDSSSGGGSGNVGIGTATRIPVYLGSTTIGSPYNNVMDSNGNIGIGSANPGQALDVQGTVTDIGEIVNGNANVSGDMLIGAPNAPYPLTTTSNVLDDGQGDGNFEGFLEVNESLQSFPGDGVFNVHGNNGDSFTVGSFTINPGTDNVLTEHNILDDGNGNVGIGTFYPLYSLDVRGNFNAQVDKSWIVIDGVKYAQNSTGIQSALNAYGPGTTFFFPDATYDITSQDNSYNANITFVMGRNAIWKLHNSTANISMLGIFGNNTVIDNGTFNGNSSNQGGSTYTNIAVQSGVVGTIIKNTVQINGNSGCITDSGTGTLIHNNYENNCVSTSMQNTEYGGIDLYTSTNAIVDDNYVTATPISLNCSASSVNPQITNNMFLGSFVNQGAGIMADSCSGEVITGNTIINTTATATNGVDGIYMVSPSGNLNAIVTNNLLMDISGPGIEIDGSEASVENNRIYLENGGAGTSGDQAGIFIGSGTTDIDVGGNSVNNSYKSGMQLGFSTGGNSYIRIHDNYVTGSGSGGIEFNNSSGVESNISILNNHIYSNTGYGIGSNSSVTFTNLQIAGNIYASNSLGNVQSNVTASPLDFPGGLLSEGNIGIGSQYPGAQLDINGTARMTGFTLSGNGAANGNVLVGNSVGVGTWMPVSTLGAASGTNYWLLNGGSNVGINTTQAVGIGTSFVGGTGEAALSVMNGNVGIGTWIPHALLTVAGSLIANISSPYLEIYEAEASGFVNPALTIGNIWNGTNSKNLVFGYDTFNGYSWMQSINYGSAYTPFYMQASGGNVGIGVTNSDNVLDVKGGVAIGSYAGSKNAPSNGLIVSGNFGIGSVNPGQALDVNGTIRAGGNSCTTLYKCVGGVDAGVIQNSSCVLCPGGSCTALNGCF